MTKDESAIIDRVLDGEALGRLPSSRRYLRRMIDRVLGELEAYWDGEADPGAYNRLCDICRQWKPQRQVHDLPAKWGKIAECADCAAKIEVDLGRFGVVEFV